MIVKLLLMNMLVILQHQMEWIMLLMNKLVILQHQMDWIILMLQVVEKRRMGMRLRYGTQMNMEAWLGSIKMKNMKIVREGGASFPYILIS
ncbi:hypothetical protein Godav_029509 [Gossypium davidsonii]|uniref:Uncharacterized protein n=1 Tax=Gossypium davidsonii TaxID=34287 RepID=A0A7J8TDD8_GOSDV|nr:hypothetical protein [Gossypium davidsonii]